MVENGIIFGRFQVLHLKHMEFLLAVKMRCQKMIIGITRPNGNEKGKCDLENPFTYYERFEMVQEALIDFGVKREEFEIVPFPIEHPEWITNYVPKDATFYMSILGKRGEEKLQILQDLGLKTEVIWRKDPETTGVTGAEVRQYIIEGKDWKPFVPKTVYEYVVSHHLDERIQKKYERKEKIESIVNSQEE